MLLRALLVLSLACLASGQLLSLLSSCANFPFNTISAGATVRAGYMLTPAKSLTYCATDPITGVCLKGIDVSINVTGFITLPVSCSILKLTWTSLKIPFNSQTYTRKSGSNDPCPSENTDDANTYQGSVVANVCAGGSMYVDPVGHPASASVSFDSNNNVDLLLFSFHVGVHSGLLSTLLSIPFCLPIALLPAPAVCLLKNVAGLLLRGECGVKCSCTSWELLKLSASVSLAGGVALNLKVCNWCTTPMDYFAICLANLANLDLDLGIRMIGNRGYNISLDAGLSLLPLCRNLRYKATSNPIVSGQCDTISLQLGGWTPAVTLGVHAKLLTLGLAVESQVLNLLSCPEVACKTPTLQLPVPVLSNIFAGIKVQAAVQLSLAGLHNGGTVAAVSASVLLTLGCTGSPFVTLPWLLSLSPYRNTLPANDNAWYPSDDSFLVTATLPNVCLGLLGNVYIAGAVTLSATLSVQPLELKVNARVRLALGGVPQLWSNITIGAKTTGVPCDEYTTPPPTTLPPTTLPATTTPAPSTNTPDPSESPSPSPDPTTPEPTQTLPPYVPPVLPPAACPLPGYSAPLCTDCLAESLEIAFYCVSDGVGGYYWSAFGVSESVPSGSIRVNSSVATPEGFLLDCGCKPIFKTCASPCVDDTCICSPKTGQCIIDAICENPPNNTNCDPCPVGSNGLECSGHGICNCSVCVCATYQGNTTFAGATCEDVPKTACDYHDCETCASDTACSWCAIEGGRCQASSTCSGFEQTCTNSTEPPPSQVPPACENSCGEHGKCVNDTDTGLVQCVCDKGYHGATCSASGGLKNKAAIISGAVVAGIVLGSLAGAGVLAYGGKKGVDWMQANTGDGSRQLVNNPAFQDSGKSVDNAAFDKV